MGALVLAVLIWFLFAERRKRVVAEKNMQAALAHKGDASEHVPMMMAAHDSSGGVDPYSSQPDATKGRPELEARSLGQRGVFKVQGN